MQASILFVLILILMTLTVLPKAHASRLTADAGLGFTNNANLTSDNQKSDLFLRASSAYSWPQGENTPRIRLAYTDYLRENANDMFSWMGSDRWTPDKSAQAWAFKGSLFGRHYTAGSPGVTEESFSHIGAGAGGERNYRVSSKTQMTWGPTAEIRKYIQDSNRMDLTAGAEASLEFEARPDLTFGTSSNFGIIFSNQSEYSRIYLDVAGDVEYNFTRQWRWYSEASIRHTGFTSRTVDQETATTAARTKRGGPVRTVSNLRTKESLSMFTLFSQISREILQNQRLSGEITVMNQSSASGLQSFSAAEIFARWTIVF